MTTRPCHQAVKVERDFDYLEGLTLKHCQEKSYTRLEGNGLMFGERR